MQNRDVFLWAYHLVHTQGQIVHTRGSKCKEIRNMSIDLDPRYPVTSFKDRKFNLSYAKAETLWYLRGNRYDTSICEKAGAWNTLIQPDGGINSNYGQDIFSGPKQFDWVIEELYRDMYSRRAIIVLGRPEMLSKDNTDHRCTMYISYAIRDGKLHQTVRMRSNDIIFGMTNDVFFFGLLHQMVYVCLKDRLGSLELGTYTHSADSMHVYERHFGMLENIVKSGKDGWDVIDTPMFTSRKEVEDLRWTQNNIVGHTDMTAWLLEVNP